MTPCFCFFLNQEVGEEELLFPTFNSPLLLEPVATVVATTALPVVVERGFATIVETCFAVRTSLLVQPSFKHRSTERRT